MSRRLHTALTWLLLSLGLPAPAALQAQALFVNDATVHTLGPQGTLQNADVLVRDGLIKAVGMQLPMPADATVIEAEGRPLTARRSRLRGGKLGQDPLAHLWLRPC